MCCIFQFAWTTISYMLLQQVKKDKYIVTCNCFVRLTEQLHTNLSLLNNCMLKYTYDFYIVIIRSAWWWFIHAAHCCVTWKCCWTMYFICMWKCLVQRSPFMFPECLIWICSELIKFVASVIDEWNMSRQHWCNVTDRGKLKYLE